MTRTMKTFKGLFALLLSLAVVMTLGVSLLSYAASSVTEKVVVTQIITENTTPSRNSYTYVLTPEDPANPMPQGTEDGKYTLPTITGSTTDETAPSFTITIDASKAGVYQYKLEKLEATPEGDVISPESHIFGWQVTEDENGELVVKPYICQSNKPIFSEPDENGYPTKITLVNAVTGEPDGNKDNKGDKGDKGEPGQDGKDGQNGQDGKDGSDGKNGSNGTNGKNGTNGLNGTSGTTTKGSRVNTGDPYQIGLWIGLIVVSAGALIAIVVVRRKKENDEDNG